MNDAPSTPHSDINALPFFEDVFNKTDTSAQIAWDSLFPRWPVDPYKKESSSGYDDLHEAKMAASARAVMSVYGDGRELIDQQDVAMSPRILRDVCANGHEALYGPYLQLLFDRLAYGDQSYSRAHTPSYPSQSLHFLSASFGKWFRWPLFANKNQFEELVPEPRAFESLAELYTSIPYNLNLSLSKDEPFEKPLRIRFTSESDKVIEDRTLAGACYREMRMSIGAVEGIADFLRRAVIAHVLSTDCRLAHLINVTEEDIAIGGRFNQVSSVPVLVESLKRLSEGTKPAPESADDYEQKKGTLLKQFLVTGAAVFSLNAAKLDGRSLWLIPLYNVPTEGSNHPQLFREKVGTWVVLAENLTKQEANSATAKPTEGSKGARGATDAGEERPEPPEIDAGEWATALSKQGSRLASYLREIECPPDRYVQAAVGLEYEKILRECVFVEEAVLIENNKAQEYLEECIDEQYGDWDWSKMVGCSRRLITLLRDLRFFVDGETFRDKEEPPTIKAQPIVFMYSEPGCGKEYLSEAIYCMSQRASGLARMQDGPKRLLKRLAKSWGDNYPEGISPELDGVSLTDETYVEKLLPLDGDKQKRRFVTMNCAMLPPDTCMTGLVGSLARPEKMLRAHLLYGGIFLDEFNTMKLGSEHSLLRAMDEPHEVGMPNGKSCVGVQPLIVIASNKAPDDLIEMGFNPAVVFRLSQHYFVIPPLRDRKEDIALVFMSFILKWDERMRPRRIDPSALRLICEMPWRDNFRGLKGLDRELENTRRRQHICSEELTFDEVVGAIARRELLRADAGTGSRMVLEVARRGA